MYVNETIFIIDKCENIGELVDNILRLTNIWYTSNDLGMNYDKNVSLIVSTGNSLTTVQIPDVFANT